MNFNVWIFGTIEADNRNEAVEMAKEIVPDGFEVTLIE